MWQSVSVMVSAVMLVSPLYAEEMRYQSETGDRFTISQTPDGKHWGSCGSPAKAEQTVFYDVSESSIDLLTKVEPQPLPKGFQQVRQRDVFTSVMADRRAETVDFLLSDVALNVQKLRSVATLKFRFVTDDGQRRQAIFQLQ